MSDNDDDRMSGIEEEEGEEPEEEEDPYDLDPNAIYDTAVLTTRPHNKDAVCVAVSPDFEYVVTGGCDDVCLVFITSESLRVPYLILKEEDTVAEVVFTPNGNYVYYVVSGTVVALSVRDNFKRFTLDIAGTVEMSHLRISDEPIKSDRQADIFVMVPLQSRAVRIGFERNGLFSKMKYFFKFPEPTALAPVPRLKQLAVAFRCGKIMLYKGDVGQNAVYDVYDLHVAVTALAVSPYFIVGGTSKGRISVFPIGGGTRRQQFKNRVDFGEVSIEDDSSVEVIRYLDTYQENLVVFGTVSGIIELHDVKIKHNSLIFRHTLSNNTIIDFGFNRDATKVYAGTHDGTVLVFSTKKGARLQLLDTFYSRGRISTFAYHFFPAADGSMTICAVSSLGHLRYFNDPFGDLPIMPKTEVTDLKDEEYVQKVVALSA